MATTARLASTTSTLAPGRAVRPGRPSPEHRAPAASGAADTSPTVISTTPVGRPSTCSIRTSSTEKPASATAANSRPSSPGWSGTATGTTAVGDGARAVLAGHPVAPGVATPERLGQHVLARPGRCCPARAAASPGPPAAHRGPRPPGSRWPTGSRPTGRRPRRRSGSCRAAPDRRSTPRCPRSPAGRAASSEDRTCGVCDTTATARSCSTGEHHDGQGTRREGQLLDGVDGRLVGTGVGGDHPRPVVDEVGTGGSRSGHLTPGHRMAADVPGRVHPGGNQRPVDRDLHGGDVGHDSAAGGGAARRPRRRP